MLKLPRTWRWTSVESLPPCWQSSFRRLRTVGCHEKERWFGRLSLQSVHTYIVRTCRTHYLHTKTALTNIDTMGCCILLAYSGELVVYSHCCWISQQKRMRERKRGEMQKVSIVRLGFSKLEYQMSGIPSKPWWKESPKKRNHHTIMEKRCYTFVVYHVKSTFIGEHFNINMGICTTWQEKLNFSNANSCESLRNRLQ